METLNYISAFSGLLPVVAGLLRYAWHDWPLRWLTIFFVVSGGFDVALAITTYFAIGNLVLMHVFVVVNLVFLAFFYRLILPHKIEQGFIMGSAAVILVSMLFKTGVENGWQTFPSFSISVQSILFILLALLYFYHLVQVQTLIPIERQPLFWINSAVLLYFSGNIFLFMLQSQIVASQRSDYGTYWIIHSVVNSIANCLYALGFLCKPPRLTSPPF